MSHLIKSMLGIFVSGIASVSTPVQAADMTERSLKFSHVLSREHPYEFGVKKFSELVAKGSAGKITVKGYADGTLGSETQSLSQAQGGIQEITIVSTAPLVGIVKEFALFDFPFLFSNEKEADAVLDGAVGRSLLEKLSPKGLIGLCFWENGFRHIANSRRPILKADDLKGLKLRVQQSPVYVEAFKAFGVNPVAMAYTEVYTAIESKAMDGFDNSYTVLRAGGFQDVIKYVSATKHSYAPAVVAAGKKFWDKLSPDEQKLLQSSCTEAGTYERQVSRQASMEDLATLKSKGVAFNEVPPAELDKMHELAKPVIDKFTKEVGEDLVKQTYAEVAKVRGSQ